MPKQAEAFLTRQLSLLEYALKYVTGGALMLGVALGGLAFDAKFRPAQAVVADDFLIVDCLLPGKIRKLGKKVTFASARRALRTSQSDCEIRGGEYTAYDRSDYSVSLQVWMPMAQEGDAKAQNYVGEIYEKGVGGGPQYSQAAQWYLKAAEQGLSAAQVNLGALYERGLGVAADPEKAAFWYRKASGLDSANLQFTPGAKDAEIQQLRREKTDVEADRNSLKGELDALRRQLNDAQRQLRKQSEKSSGLSDELTKARAQQAAAPTAKPDDAGRAAGLAAELEAQRASEAKLKAAIAALEKQSSQLASQLESTATAKEKELAAARDEIEKLRGLFADQQDSAQEKAQRVAELTKTLAEREAGLGAELAKARLESARSISDRTQAEKDLAAEKASLEAALAEAQAAAAASSSKSSEMARSLAALEKKLAESGKQTAALIENTASGKDKELAAARDEIEKLRGLFAGQQQSAQAERQRVAELTKTLAERESALSEELAKAKRENASAQTQRMEAEKKLAAEKAALEAALAEAQKAAAGQQGGAQAEKQRVAELTKALAEREAELANERTRAREESVLASPESSDNEKKLAAEKEALMMALTQAQQAVATSTAKSSEMAKNLARLEKELAMAAEQNATLQKPRQMAEIGPEISIIDPPLATTRGAQYRSAMVQSTGAHVIIGRIASPVELKSVKVNDTEVAVDQNAMFSFKAPIGQRENLINVVAVDVKGARRTLTFNLVKGSGVAPVPLAGPEGGNMEPKALGLNFGDYHALVIGNSRYQFLPELKTAKNDAVKVSKVLREAYGFKVTLLLDATRYDILSAMNKLREELTEDQNLLIYYAGHGDLDRVNSRGNWLPVDAESASTANWISNIQVTDILNAMSAKQIMLVVDSCYSGTLTRTGLAQLDSGISPDKRGKWIEKMLEKRSRVVLTSGGVAPVLDGGGGGHSVFARAFLNALESNTGVLEGQRLFQSVSAEVAASAATAEFEQLPQYAPIKFAGHEAGDFFLVRSQLR